MGRRGAGRRGAERWGRRTWRGGDLVHEIPPALVLPFPLHQVHRVFSPVAGRRLGALKTAGPCSSVPFAPSPPRFFARGRAPTWCTKNRRPLFLRSLCTKSPAFLRPWPAPTWCTKSRQPLYLRSLCTKSPAFFRPWSAPSWCTKSRRPLYLRSLCTKSHAFLRPWPGGRGTSPLASPCFFVLRHHVPEHSSHSRRAGVVPHHSLTLVSSS